MRVPDTEGAPDDNGTCRETQSIQSRQVASVPSFLLTQSLLKDHRSTSPRGGLSAARNGRNLATPAQNSVSGRNLRGDGNSTNCFERHFRIFPPRWLESCEKCVPSAVLTMSATLYPIRTRNYSVECKKCVSFLTRSIPGSLSTPGQISRAGSAR